MSKIILIFKIGPTLHFNTAWNLIPNMYIITIHAQK